tara:strand:- start:2257 stop:2622 length:366 start_codon:yes stop_codon:yes gene_type:complete
MILSPIIKPGIKAITNFASHNNADLFLSSSIVLETACTLCLTNVNKNKLWFVPIYTGYGISFYLFPKCFDKYSLSTAYTLWSGFGVVFTFIVDILLQREKLKLQKVIGMITVLSGIFITKS